MTKKENRVEVDLGGTEKFDAVSSYPSLKNIEEQLILQNKLKALELQLKIAELHFGHSKKEFTEKLSKVLENEDI